MRFSAVFWCVEKTEVALRVTADSGCAEERSASSSVQACVKWERLMRICTICPR